MKTDNFNEDLDQIVDLLTPKASPRMPASIKTNVLSQIRRRESFKNFFTMKTLFSKITASAAAIAAVIVVAVVSVKPAMARTREVGAILDRSIKAADSPIEAMGIVIAVRTRPHENFAYINYTLPFVDHHLWINFDSPMRWMLKKEKDGEGRTIVFDGSEKFMWNEGATLGFKGDRNTNLEEWFDILLDPTIIPMREKAALQEGVKYRIEEDGDETILKADVKARGDFSNNYCRNSSIEESDTHRELRFDRETGQLKGMKIFVKIAGVEILVVDVKSILYVGDGVIDDAMSSLPESVTEWRDVMTAPQAGGFSGISASQAARLIADAIDKGDIESVKETFVFYDLGFINELFKGAKVLKLGKPFRSGLYPGVFVPCKVRMGDGRVERLKFALRNDNPDGVWLVDGGI